MPRCYREPTVTEALADPLIRMVMEADGVDVDELDAELTRTAAELSRRRVRSVAAETRPCSCW
jgi:hypothetical protein